MQKILKIIAAVFGLLGIVFLARIISAGDDAIKSGAEAGLVDPMAFVAYAILLVVIVAVVIFIFRNILINPSGLKNTLIGVGAFALVLIISYFALATGADESFNAGLYKSGENMVTEGQSKLVGGGLIAFYILIVVAAIAMTFAGAKNIINK